MPDSQFTGEQTELDRLTRVEVTLEHTVRTLDKLAETLNQHFLAKSKVNWALLISSITVFLTFVGGFYFFVHEPVRDDVQDLRTRQGAVETYLYGQNTINGSGEAGQVTQRLPGLDVDTN